MDISFVLAVYNNLELTKNFYKHLRITYPDSKLIISDGGSNDGTQQWLSELNDSNLKITTSNNRISFSETYNKGIKLVETSKLVLVHNDMVIGKKFLETLNYLLTEKILLSYTTIEPPIFKDHNRPGKIIMNFGDNFDNFQYQLFENHIEKLQVGPHELTEGATFFMSGYKKMFEDIGYFDGATFVPCFCEDDDFLIRAKLKGYDLKTTNHALVYHFVSKTSRFGDDFKNDRTIIEINSNRNFIRKWGMPISSFNELGYWKINNFKYEKLKIGLLTKTSDINIIANLEPFFDKIDCDNLLSSMYINHQQSTTSYNLNDKFSSLNECNVIVIISEKLTNEDFTILTKLRLVLPEYTAGKYKVGNLLISIKN